MIGRDQTRQSTVESMASNVHGTCVDLDGYGVLLLGPPGAGKSDLALRLIDTPGFGIGDPLRKAMLVADDQVQLRAENGSLVASAPETIAGYLEVRGLGVVRVTAICPRTTVRLIVTLDPCEIVDRLPDPPTPVLDLCGVDVPRMALHAFEASAPARVRAAVTAISEGRLIHEIQSHR